MAIDILINMNHFWNHSCGSSFYCQALCYIASVHIAVNGLMNMYITAVVEII